MRDETYAFVEDVKNRKQLARGYRHKKIGVRSNRCSLPSDNMTAAQRRRMNGAVKTYDMAVPHLWEEVKSWPADLQKEYLSKLSQMGATLDRQARVLGVSGPWLSRIYSSLGFPTRKRTRKMTAEEEERWEEFLRGGGAEVEEETKAEPEPETRAEPELPPIVCKSIEVVFTGTLEDALRAVSLLPIGNGQHRISIRVE